MRSFQGEDSLATSKTINSFQISSPSWQPALGASEMAGRLRARQGRGWLSPSLPDRHDDDRALCIIRFDAQLRLTTRGNHKPGPENHGKLEDMTRRGLVEFDAGPLIGNRCI
jgi:hypothetical protein